MFLSLKSVKKQQEKHTLGEDFLKKKEKHSLDYQSKVS